MDWQKWKTDSPKAIERRVWTDKNNSEIMIPRKKIKILDKYRLYIVFDDGKAVEHDVKDDIDNIPSYKVLEEEYGLFKQVQLDQSRTYVYWNDEVDLLSDMIYEYGKKVI